MQTVRLEVIGQSVASISLYIGLDLFFGVLGSMTLMAAIGQNLTVATGSFMAMNLAELNSVICQERSFNDPTWRGAFKINTICVQASRADQILFNI